MGREGRAPEAPVSRMEQKAISPMPLSSCLTPCHYCCDVTAHYRSLSQAPELDSGLRCKEISAGGL